MSRRNAQPQQTPAPVVARPAAPRISGGTVGDAASGDALLRLTGALAELRAHAIQPMLQQAVACLRVENHKEGGEWAIRALEHDEKNAHAWHLLAIAREKAADYTSAMNAYEKALQLDPENSEIANDLGRVAYQLEMPEMAEKFFAAYLARNPGSVEGVNNLACAQRDQSRFAEAIETLRPAIYANPGSALLWNALGSVLAEQGDLVQAATFFEEALKLEPAFQKARYNLASTRAGLGELHQALADVEEAIGGTVLETELAMMQLSRANMLIATGDLERGWEAYEGRFDQYYAEVTHFLRDEPRWTPEADLAGRSLLVIGEQGLGDEVLFANVLPDVVEALGPEGRLTLALEPRLVSLFERSFPQGQVVRHYTGRVHHHVVRAVRDVPDHAVDMWTPIGSLLRRFRSSVEDYPARERFLQADPARVEYWRGVMAEAGPGPKVGLLWKSLRLDSGRIRFFSPFEQWRPVLETPGVTFVNLQYGDCAPELEQARETLGVDIVQPAGIDLKDDLDDLAALCCAMDLVVGPANATTNIAAACGAPTWLVSTLGAWPRLGTDRYPWYPQARVFVRPGTGDWLPVMHEVADALAAEFPAA